MTAKELYVLISDKCNFACAHCLNSSGPNAERWMLSDKDIGEIANEVNTDISINCIHFSGGEPTLFLNQIAQLQSRVTREIKYSITTNGSFWENPEKVTSKIKIDDVVLSFDRFRAPFIRKEQIVELASWLNARGYHVTINYLVTKVEDLLSIADFEIEGVKVLINGAIKSGRFSSNKGEDNYKDSNWTNRTCPSVSTSIDLRGAEKINFLPQHGYTPCCGPLVFDQLADKSFTATSSIENYQQNLLRKVLAGENFEKQFSHIGIRVDNSIFNSACEACVALYGANGELPSLYEISKKNTQLKFYKTINPINKSLSKLISQSHHVGHVYTATRKSMEKNLVEMRSLEGISEEDVNETNLDKMIDFIEENYYMAFPEQYTQEHISTSRKSTSAYMALGVTAKIYKKENKIVGCFLANRFNPHPMLGIPSIHIGYWGYNYSLINKEEINYIKNCWIKNLLNIHVEGDIFNASIRLHNSRSINFINKLGFKQYGIRFDLRIKP